MTKPVTAYAEGTEVSVEKSRAELDTLLRKHGADQRFFADDDAAGMALIGFKLDARHFQLRIPLPDKKPFLTRMVNRGHGERPEARTPAQVDSAYEQACRVRWRAVVLVVKAKLEMVRLGLSTAQEQFMADLLLPDGGTLAKSVEGHVAKAYADGVMPPLLLGMGARE